MLMYCPKCFKKHKGITNHKEAKGDMRCIYCGEINGVTLKKAIK